MAKLSITVNKVRCIGSGDCVETAPAVFQLDAEGKSEVVNPTGAGDSVIVSAARSCPVKAITVVDEAGVQLFPPPKKQITDASMAIRKHRAGELVIEQTRDFAIVRAMLARGGLTTDGIEWPAACYLLAYFGDDAVGVVGVEPKIDAALIRSLYVDESMRRRGIGSALIAAARKAAHTRGARHLYCFSSEAGQLFERHKFSVIPVGDVVAALPGVPEVEFFLARPDELEREVAYHLDISADGLIER